MTFQIERLGNVAAIIRGITFKPDDLISRDEPSAVFCFRTKNVQRSLDEGDLIAVPPRFVGREDQIVREGDILVSSANSWNLVGKCCYVPQLQYKATAGGFISILRADGKHLDSRYLYHWFASPNVQTLLRSFGRKTTNISNLNIGLTLNTKIPLPSLEEQRRIAEVLDRADALRQKRRLALQKLDTLLQSVFLEMFGDPVTNPKGWDRHELKSLSTQITDGVHATPKYLEAGIPFISTVHVGPEGIDWSAANFISNEEHQNLIRRCKPQVGDVLYTKVGSVGLAVPITEEKEFSIFVQLALIKPRNDLCDYVFLSHLLNQPSFRHSVLSRLSGATMKYIGIGEIGKLGIFLPPRDLQDQLVKAAGPVQALKSRMKESNVWISRNFKSIQEKAFKGELFKSAVPPAGLEPENALEQASA